MALQNLTFSFPNPERFTALPTDWSHTGVVGSGDMEVLLRSAPQSGRVEVTVVTPVKGFDAIWEKVIARFVAEMKLGDAKIEINDNNSTPYIVAMRLKQALLEAKEGDGI